MGLIFQFLLLASVSQVTCSESLLNVEFPAALVMDHQYLNEDTHHGIIYLGDSDIRRYQAFLQDGLFKNSLGENLETDRIRSFEGFQGEALAVLDSEGQLYVFEDFKTMPLHHSSVVEGRGKTVLWAGVLNIQEGRLEKISDQSGHYKPSYRHTAAFITWLKRKGVDLSQVELQLTKANQKVAAEEALEAQWAARMKASESVQTRGFHWFQ